MTDQAPSTLEWPDPILGHIDIPIGEIKDSEVNPDHVTEKVAE